MYRASLQENETVTTLKPITTMSTITTMATNSSMNMTGPPLGAYQGICMSDCKLLYTVAPLLFVGMLLTFMTCSPVQTATLRYVMSRVSPFLVFVCVLPLLLASTKVYTAVLNYHYATISKSNYMNVI